MFKTIALRHRLAAASAAGLLALPTAHAQVCPFDNGGSTLENDGLVLTRYALGLRGAPMLANTSFAAGDGPTIESNINCPSCGLRVTDDKDALNNPIFTVADATIISRKIAGFSGAALTNGIPSLGSGTRNTPGAVQSFLLAGCGATGGTVTSVTAGAGLTGGTFTTSGTLAADTTYLQRRVSTACATGSYVIAIAADGTPNCGTPPAGGSGTVTSVGAGYGLVANGPNVVGNAVVSNGLIELANGYILPQGCSVGQVPKSGGGGSWVCAADNVGTTVINAFTQGGNAFGAPGVLGTTDGQPLTVGTGLGDGLRITRSNTVAPPGLNGFSKTVNVVNGSRENSVAAGVSAATIAGGGHFIDVGPSSPKLFPNQVLGNAGTVGGGSGNTAGASSGEFATVAGGAANTASSFASSVSGGNGNSASDWYSSVAGGNSNKASGLASFVAGGDSNSALGLRSFAAGYGATASDSGEFVWNGSNASWNPKALGAWGGNTTNTFNVRADRGIYFQTGGNVQCTLAAGGTGWNCASDRALKEKIVAITPRAVLEKVASLPISTWVIKGYEQLHMGPMAQDFRAAFGLGRDDKTINTTDAQGVALAAIQGLNQKLTEQIRRRDNEIAKLRAKADLVEREMLAIKRKLGM